MNDQQRVVDFLSSPAAHGGATVERIETHSAIVFLTGSRALKLKRAVRFDYLDFSTIALRREACEAEVRINRRTAPSLYRGVVAVTEDSGRSLTLGGAGSPVEWLVDMARFDQNGLFDRLAARGELALSLMAPLGTAIARFHRAAEHRPEHGGRAGMTWVAAGNAAGFAEQGAGVLAPALAAEVNELTLSTIARLGDLLERRRHEGCVRQCHGDLHLRNIVLLDEHPTLFDAVEFNQEIACIDVLYDLAFLVMDLWRRRLPQHASAVFNRYLAETADVEGLALLPLFLSCRAGVRAKTSATAARVQSGGQEARELQDLAREYLGLARDLLQPVPSRLIAIGGLSGCGKSTLAMALAPSTGSVPGALVLRSDEIRKSLLGAAPLQRLGAEGYTTDMTARVYDALISRAVTGLRAGHSVIIDAVLARPSDRTTLEEVAAAAAVPFVGIWLDAPADVLMARAEARRSDASDAGAGVVRRQLAQDPGTIRWHRLDASGGREQVLAAAKALVTLDPADAQ